jgi:hypothetical protein
MDPCFCAKCYCGCYCYDCAAKFCHGHCSEKEGTCTWRLSTPWTFHLKKDSNKNYGLRSDLVSIQDDYSSIYAEVKCCEALKFCLRARSLATGLPKTGKCTLSFKAPSRCVEEAQSCGAYHGHIQLLGLNGEEQLEYEFANYRLGTFVSLPLRLHKPFYCGCEDVINILVRHGYNVGHVALRCNVRGGIQWWHNLGAGISP